MAWLNSTFPPQAAIERGLATWDLYLSNWALTGAAADINSEQFPNPATQAVLPSVFGVSIGPFSDVDRCRIQYNPTLAITTGASPVSTLDLFTQKFLDLGNPITYPLPGPLVVLRDLTYDIPDNFIANNGSASVTPFDFVGAGAAGLAPRLHLVFHLAPPTNLVTGRHPRIDRLITVAQTANGSRLERVIPCQNRRRITFQALGGSGTVTLRVGAIFPSTGTPVERTLSTFAGVTAGAVVSATYNNLAGMQFITVWQQTTADVGSVEFSVEQFDD